MRRALLAIALVGCAAPASPATPAGVPIGEEGRLSTGTETAAVVIAVTPEDFDALTKASVAKDTLGFASIVMSGRAFEVEAGTRVLVIGQSFARREVRILEGPAFGRSGWVPTEFVLAGSAAPTPTVTSTSPSPTAPAAPTTAFSVTITASTYGTIRATTTPGASCTAQARLPSGNVSQAAALSQSRTADGSGSVVWSYGTSSSTTKGTGTHTVTCTVGGQTDSASASFTVR